MKFFIYSDPHWSSYSSILRTRGERFSIRLENLIQTINWCEETAEETGCEKIICCGDFFDKSELNAEEIAALRQIKYSNKQHYFLVGNHETGRSSLQFSTSHVFSLCPNTRIIDFPEAWTTANGVEIAFLPYISNSDRLPLTEYFHSANPNRVIFSHNDIAGIQMGKFISKEGFTVKEIEENCRLFINGHLHNESCLYNIINIGNISGQNFSEDGWTYRHKAIIFNDEDFSVQEVFNPYALYFYKCDLINYKLEDFKDFYPNSVVMAHIMPQDYEKYKAYFEMTPQGVAYRLLLRMDCEDCSHADDNVEHMSLNFNYLDKFVNYIKQYVGNDKIVMDELEKVVHEDTI